MGFLKLVPGAGLEPAQSCDREILSQLLRPPIHVLRSTEICIGSNSRGYGDLYWE